MLRFKFAISVLLVAGCGSTEVIQNPPTVVGERQDAGGNVIERIVLEETVTLRKYPITPEGPHRKVVKDEKHFFLERTGQPRREISQSLAKLNYCRSYVPVTNSSQWVGAHLENDRSGNAIAILGPDGKLLSHTDHLQIIVFDDQHTVELKEFDAFWINQESEAYQFKDGNRLLVFRSPDGFKQYDVLANRMSDIGPKADGPPLGPLP